MRYSSSQNSHFEKVNVDFIDQLVANFQSTDYKIKLVIFLLIHNQKKKSVSQK